MSKESHLFRSEAISAIRETKFGTVLLHQPWGYIVASGVSVLIVLLIVSFSYFGIYTKKTTARGLLMPEHGILRLTSSAAGVLTRINVADESEVEKGEALFVISGEQFSGSEGIREQISKQYKKRKLLLEQNKKASNTRFHEQASMTERRMRSIEAELLKLDEEQILFKKRVALAKESMKRQKQLFNNKVISISQLQLAEAELLTLEGQQHTLERTHSSLTRERLELISIRDELKSKNLIERNAIDGEIASLQQEVSENDVRHSQSIRTPISGMVTGVTSQIGQFITAGTILASIIPSNAKLYAHIYISSDQLGFIKNGQSVKLRYSSYPYQKFGMGNGIVIDISSVPYAVQELPLHVANTIQSSNAKDVVYRVVVALDEQFINVYGRKEALKTGMYLEADIHQDTRRIYEWVLEPIYSIKGKIL
ncbi:HlyD family efflux transporter periplasmic adaptor subunit [Aeromonas veronii]|uniref:HlyD family secretion protein n=1 Tax=Aeromonas veronii TaxID=654 RepID=UPI0033068E45|nr:HlyD family efflux transporter periplasmic adaptor subunit [Aeromonas veronii]